MCLAIPSEIVEVKEKMATVSISGVQRRVSLILLPEDVEIGDYVLVHAGFAIQKIDRQAAQEALRLIDELFKEEDLANTL